MSRDTYVVEIGEVIVNGANVPRRPAELRALLHDAIGRALHTAALPPGRVARTAVTVRADSQPAGAAALADNVGRAVASAIGGRPSRG